jgi:hypothetical protein
MAWINQDESLCVGFDEDLTLNYLESRPVRMKVDIEERVIEYHDLITG